MEYKLTFADYNEAMKQNKLLGLKCKCGAVSATPRMVCKKCGGTDLEIITLKGEGKVKTFSTLFVAAEGREGELPYTVVIVELDEGAWIMGNMTGIDPNAASIDMLTNQRVKMVDNRVFAGDKFSAGESTRLLFALAG